MATKSSRRKIRHSWKTAHVSRRRAAEAARKLKSNGTRTEEREDSSSKKGDLASAPQLRRKEK